MSSEQLEEQSENSCASDGPPPKASRPDATLSVMMTEDPPPRSARPDATLSVMLGSEEDVPGVTSGDGGEDDVDDSSSDDALPPPTKRSERPVSQFASMHLANAPDTGGRGGKQSYKRQYDYLFQSTAQNGIVPGAEAVAILSKSGLQKDVLAAIWDRADKDKAGFLNWDGFVTCIQLIAIVQGGGSVNAQLSSSFSVPPPQLDGVEYPDVEDSSSRDSAPDDDGAQDHESSDVEDSPAPARPLSVAATVVSSTTAPAKLNVNIDGGEDEEVEREGQRVVTVQVDDVKKGGGVKKFTSYIVRTTPDDVSVGRRYSDFDWLHDKLTKTYPYRLVPALPPKQATGKFEEDFLVKRRRNLEKFFRILLMREVFDGNKDVEAFLTSSDWEKHKKDRKKDKTDDVEFEFNPKAKEAKNLVSSSAEALIESVKVETTKFVQALGPTIEQFENLALRRRKYGAELLLTNKALVTVMMGSASSGDAADACSRNTCWNADCKDCATLQTSLFQLTKRNEELAGLYEAEYERESMGLADSMQEFLDMAKALLDACENGKAPIKDLASQQKRVAGTKAKLEKEKGKPKKSKKEIDKLEKALQQDELRLVRAEYLVHFVNYCLEGEAAYFHKHRFRRHRQMMRQYASMQADFYESTGTIWEDFAATLRQSLW